MDWFHRITAVCMARGETLTYAAQWVLTRALHGPGVSSERDFESSLHERSGSIQAKRTSAFRREASQTGGLRWTAWLRGQGRFRLQTSRVYPSRSQITHLACEEGWSYIAQWTGVPLSHVLDKVGVLPQAKYVAYFSIEPDWWDSVDMADALHPQTLVAYGMNGSELAPGLGGPLRLRVPRQLGYKNVKYITRLTVTDDLKRFGKGLGSAAPEGGYAWYAGI